MTAEASLFRRLKDGVDVFSRNQRVLAKYVLANYQTVAFSNVSQLAEQSGVSEATIVRFAKALRFSGYPAFQKEIRRLVRADLKGTERFTLSDARTGHRHSPLDLVIDKELENISALRDAFDAKAFRRALQMLRSAPEVVVVGTRSTASLASHFWFGLSKLDVKVTRVLSIASDAYDYINRLDRRSCVVMIGFPRYLKDQVALLDFVKRSKLAALTITDSAFSPLKGDVSLFAPAESASFVAFHSAPLILLNALLHELSTADKGKTLAALNRFEAMAESQKYFQSV